MVENEGLGSVTVNGVGTITVTDEDSLHVANSLFNMLMKKVSNDKGEVEMPGVKVNTQIEMPGEKVIGV
jgi:hypothetical protein